MIIVGPIALLLIEQGLRNGVRGGVPAAVGVAAADLSFASASALAGVAAANVLAPIEPMLRLGAIGVLGVLAWRLWAAARADLVAMDRSAGAEILLDEPLAAPVGGRAMERGAASLLRSDNAGGELDGTPRMAKLALAAEFFAITAVNPLTVLVFTSIVVGGAAGVGTLGWVLGMVAASLMVNMTFVAIGHGLGAVLDERRTARLRMGGALLIVGLAAYFALA